VRRELVRDSVAVALVYAALCFAARAAGFDHVSDDDFSRVTIAQAFAHRPSLDPSRTSWLPFPFWLLGGAMAVFGRSLATANALSILFAAIAAATPYVALRVSDVPRGRALFAVAFALGTPWAVWLGAATVPESFTATLSAAGAIGLAALARKAADGEVVSTRTMLLFAGAVLAAALSRYEPWPVAAVLAIAVAIKAVRSKSLFAVAAICAIGPLLWMAWNAHAHDGPLHFFRRVSSFKRALGDGQTNVSDALLLYPRLLFTTRPEVVVPAVFVLIPALRDPELRRRWAIPLLCAAAQIAFLAYGNVRDGAPAHHPERALLGTLVILALFVADAGFVTLRELTQTVGLAARAGAACVAVAWVISSARGYDPPGEGPSEDRRAQVARGEQLRASGTKSIVLTPCAYEHFALIAAYGAPENVEVRPRNGLPIGSDCPDVQVSHAP
jgi:hypothetical protein